MTSSDETRALRHNHDHRVAQSEPEYSSAENEPIEGKPDHHTESVDHHQIVFDAPEDADDLRELAEAERAAARHASTPEQDDRLARAHQARRADERLAGWRDNSRG